MDTTIELITTAEAASVLGVTQRQVQRLIANGSLTVAKTYGPVRVLNKAAVTQLAAERSAA